MNRLLREFRRMARDTWVNEVLAAEWIPGQVRWRLLNAAGLHIDRAKINADCLFGSDKVTIGAGSFVNHGCFFDGYAPITVGRNVRLGPQVMLGTSTHVIGPAECRAGDATGQPITVGDGCWLGARVTVLPGVTIGPGTVVAAGAVVTADCKPNAMYAGVPARWVRDL